MTKVPFQYIGAIKAKMGRDLSDTDMLSVWETWRQPGVTIVDAVRIVSNDIEIRERMRHTARQTVA